MIGSPGEGFSLENEDSICKLASNVDEEDSDDQDEEDHYLENHNDFIEV